MAPDGDVAADRAHLQPGAVPRTRSFDDRPVRNKAVDRWGEFTSKPR
jgi:hypothetical protein